MTILGKALVMLSWRTPFWLFIFCICATVMTFFTLNYLPHGDVRSVRSSLLPYSRLDANEIVIRFTDTKKEIKCIKKNGVWYVDDGYLVRANADRVSLLLNALVGDAIRERITKRQRDRRELTLKDFGLENHNTELIIKSGKEEVAISIGNAAPYENTVFVMSSNSSEVYIVEGVLRDIIPTNIDDIRDKTLFPHSIALINKLEISSGKENSFVVEKDSSSGIWQMTSPVQAPASTAVEEVLQSLGFASISSFVWHPVGNIVSKRTISDYISPYGLDTTEAQSLIRVWLAGVADPIEIRIGRPLPNDSGLVYAFSTVDNSVFTLDQATIAPFFMGFETMRNHSVFTMSSHNISSISYKNQSEFCLLSLNEVGDWEISIPSKQKVDMGTVEDFVSKLSLISDSGIVDDKLELSQSFVQLDVVDKNEKNNQFIFYYDNAQHPTNVYLNTTMSSFNTRISPEALPEGFLDKNFAAKFRSKEIFNFEPTGVQEFTIRRGTFAQSAYYTAAGEWRSRDNSHGEIFVETAISLIKELSALKAEWVEKLFVIDVKTYGFANPKAELLVVFSNNIDHPYGMPTAIIQVGNQLPTGEYYLRIKGEEELFVVSGEFVKKLLEAKLY